MQYVRNRIIVNAKDMQLSYGVYWDNLHVHWTLHVHAIPRSTCCYITLSYFIFQKPVKHKVATFDSVLNQV